MASHATPITNTSDIELRFVRLIETDHLEVPMLPEVARKVVLLAEDPDGDAATMAKMMQADQTLAAQVMRIANSAAYNPAGAAMVSLQQAITRLGMKRMAEIALAASLHAKLFDVPGHEEHVSAILRRALAAGLWAKEIARSARKNVEAAFLGGLLHDIGRPVALQSLVEIARKNNITIDGEELYVLEDRYQRQVGVSVVKHWNMPTMVCDVIEHFDDYKNADVNLTQVMIVIAGALVADTLTSSDVSEEQSDILFNSDILAELNFYRSDIEDLLEKRDAVNESVGVMLP